MNWKRLTLKEIDVNLSHQNKIIFDFGFPDASEEGHLVGEANEHTETEHVPQIPLNSEQRLVFDIIIKAVADSKGLFFLDAPGDVAKLLQLKELSIT